MSDNIVVTIIALLYTASSGLIFYLNQHFFISKKAIRQVVNWPLAKVRDAIVTSILRLISDESIFENERVRVEEFYDTILIKRNEEKKVFSLEERLKILKKLSMVNIALPMVFLFCTIFCLFDTCKGGVSLLIIVQKHLKLLILLLALPWGVYFILYFLADNCKTQLDAIEPRNTEERDEE